jgi:hypothetical protein
MPTRRVRKDGLEELGEVTAPSGTVLVIDTGLLNLWCHDRPPLMPEGALPDDVVATANSSIDLRIDGKDAERAGRAFGRNWHPRFLYDVPAKALAEVGAGFDACVRQHGLEARLVPLGGRVTHRERVSLALEYGGGAGQLSFHGVWAVAVRGAPADRPLAVFGERMPAGPDAGRWRRVHLECRPGASAVRTEQVGDVMVDEARLMFADVDALGHWEHERPLDGRADYVFWGRDAEAVADRTAATSLGEGVWGWVDLPVREAVERGTSVEQLRDRGLKFAGDFRPHSHHYLVMRQVRASPTQSGTVEVGGARVCTFMTTWGDGIYPVLRDLDAAGGLVRLRVDLGNDQIVERQRDLDERGS